MTIHVALLRAINLPAHKPVAMADLRDFFTKVGLGEPRTLLQTGNVVFRSSKRTGAGLERFLETEADKRLHLQTDFFVRTVPDWAAVIARNPFPNEAKADPAHLVVMFLKDAPDAKAVDQLNAAISGREVARAVGNQAYIVYPDGIGRSRLTTAIIEKKLGTRGTGRNWNTVLKLAALVKT
jgi:uncharacterized protein (DUF1697 family)